MQLIRAGLFGLTHPHSEAHFKTLVASSKVAEIVLYDANPAAVNGFVATDKVAGAYSDLDALLDAEPMLFGVACVRNDHNPDLCLRLFERGIHVVSEKPIGASVAAVSRVVAGAAKAGVQLGVMYQNRYHPAVREARRLIQGGAIGRVMACESRMVTSQVKFRDPQHWLFDRSISGGGILSWLGCHHIDLLCYVMDADIVAVSAIVDTLSGEAIDVEDVASASFRFSNGALGSLQAGYHLAISGAGYMGPSYDTYMGFRGDMGRVFWTPSGGPSEVHLESVAQGWHTASRRTFDYALPQVDAYGGAYGVAFLDDFIQSVLDNGTPPASGEDALKVAKITEAAYRSNATGQRVEVKNNYG